MKRRPLFLTIAAGLLVLGFGALDARAASVSLPNTLNNLLGNSTTVDGTANGGEVLTFSAFTFTASSVPPGSAPAASSIDVSAFTSVHGETGFALTGTLSAPANTMVDVSITYVVTAPAGQSLTDAFLSTAGGGSGSYLVNETLTNPVTGLPIATLAASSTGAPGEVVSFGGVQSILVTKDIFLTGGATGESLSVIQQAFSSNTTPEPASWALLGIGMTGFLAFRRLFKRHAVA
jgi:PEP-CTERM motif